MRRPVHISTIIPKVMADITAKYLQQLSVSSGLREGSGPPVRVQNSLSRRIMGGHRLPGSTSERQLEPGVHGDAPGEGSRTGLPGLLATEATHRCRTERRASATRLAPSL